MIRKYRETDMERVLDIWWEASALAHPFLEAAFVEKVKNDMRELYLPNSKTWVFEEDNEVVGFISMLENEIGGLFVKPDEHARGIGTQLVNHVLDMISQIEVEVFEKNRIGRAFYDKYGFVPLKEFQHAESKQSVLRLKCSKKAIQSILQ